MHSHYQLKTLHSSAMKTLPHCAAVKDSPSLLCAGPLLAEQNCPGVQKEGKACHCSHQYAGVHDSEPHPNQGWGFGYRHSSTGGSWCCHAFRRKRVRKIPFQSCSCHGHSGQEDRTGHVVLSGKNPRSQSQHTNKGQWQPRPALPRLGFQERGTVPYSHRLCIPTEAFTDTIDPRHTNAIGTQGEMFLYHEILIW